MDPLKLSSYTCNRTLVRTPSREAFCTVTVIAKQLILVFRVSVSTEPGPRLESAGHFLGSPIYCAIVIDMVNGKKLWSGLSATYATATIIRNDLGSYPLSPLTSVIASELCIVSAPLSCFSLACRAIYGILLIELYAATATQPLASPRPKNRLSSSGGTREVISALCKRHFCGPPTSGAGAICLVLHVSFFVRSFTDGSCLFWIRVYPLALGIRLAHYKIYYNIILAPHEQSFQP